MISGIVLVLGLALLPALATFAGGLLAEWLRPSPRAVNRALHAATGIILAVVAIEVMPQALGAAPGRVLALMFVLGGGTYLAVEAAVERWQASAQTSEGAPMKLPMNQLSRQMGPSCILLHGERAVREAQPVRPAAARHRVAGSGVLR